MPKGRKNGCPVNIRNWLVYIQTGVETWQRIYGLKSLNRNLSSTTEDASAETDSWSENYVTKRSATLKLEGKEIVDEATGAADAGQEVLNGYAEAVGCDADATLKFIDPYGHGWIADYIVTGREQTADDKESKVSWDLDQVGEAEVLPYVNITSISLKDGASAATTLSLKVSDAPKIITVAFTPDSASNKRFRVSNTSRSVVMVSDVTENSFTLKANSAGTATLTVTTANGGKTATLTVNVTN